MAKNYDVAVWNNDIVFVDGDFGIAESDQQHIQDTINAFPGWWKQYPADGVGVRAYVGSAGILQDLARAVKLQLKSDGYTANNPEIVMDERTGRITIYPNVADV